LLITALCRALEGTDDIFVLCRSQGRKEKENAILSRFETRLETKLNDLAHQAQIGKAIYSGLTIRMWETFDAKEVLAAIEEEKSTILLPMTTSADGAVTAERIRTELKKETFSPVPGQEVHVTVSIGLAQYKPQEEMKSFVHRVDQLMYQGKKNGKDRVCCES